MSVDIAVDLMLDGEAEEAAKMLEPAEAGMNESLRKAALACAYSLQSRQEDAERVLNDVGRREDPGAPKAIMSTSRAYMAMHDGDMDSFYSHMKDAMECDPSFPLPWLSMGLFYQWKKGDFAKAREMFEKALQLRPDSHLVHRHLLGLEASDGKLERAWSLFRSLPEPRQGRRVPWTLPVTLSLASTPFGGGLVVLLIVALSFLPYVSLVVVPAWVILSVASYRQLPRISGRLALLPGIGLVAITGGLILEWLITGSAFP